MTEVRRVLVYGFCLVSLFGCGNERAAKGEPCEVAADCKGALVCALTAEGADEHVCVAQEDTWPQKNCFPGADPTMVCELIKKQSAGKSCSTSTECTKGLSCKFAADAGTEAVCTAE